MRQNSFLIPWLILGVAMVYLGGAIGFNLYQEHERVKSREQERLLAQARVIEENATQNLISINQALVQLRMQLNVTDGPDLNEHLKILVDAMPGVRSMAILDVNGDIRASNQPSVIGSNFSERDYFNEPRQHPDESMLYISPPFRSVLGGVTISAALMIPGPSGEFAGVVGVTLDPQYFFTLLDSVRYAPDMGVSIVHWDGVVFMTDPTKKGIDGKNLAQPGSFFTRHKDSGHTANIFTGATYASGEERMIALRTVNSSKLKLDKPLVLTAARVPTEIYAAWRNDLIKNGCLYGVVALFSICALYVVQRRQRESDRQLGEAAKELRAKQIEVLENEEKYRAIIETTDTGYVILDASGKVNDANREYIRLSGHTRLEEITGRNPIEWTAKHDRERIDEEIKKCLETGSVRSLEVDYIDKQGRISPVEINATVIHREASLQIVSLCQDITERKRAEEALRVNEERLRMALEGVQGGVWESNLTTGENFWDERMAHLLALPPEEVATAQHRWLETIHPDDLVRVEAAFTAACQLGGPPYQAEYRVRRWDGAERWFLSQGVQWLSSNGSRRMSGVVQDITERKKIEEELKTVNEELERRVEHRTQELKEAHSQFMHIEKLTAIGKLSASIAHEFNSPLQAVMTVLKGLRLGAQLDDGDRKLLEAAIGESERMKNLIRNLQDFYRPSSSRRTFVNLHATIDSLLMLYKADFYRNNVKIELRLAEMLPHIMAVPDQIKQVFLNLLNNAAEACLDQGGLIVISTWREDEKVAVAIRDNGIGIQPSDMEHIFRPFFSTKTTVKGTGLGLSVSYGIIKRHGGAIRVESEPGKGSTFTVLLQINSEEDSFPAA